MLAKQLFHFDGLWLPGGSVNNDTYFSSDTMSLELLGFVLCDNICADVNFKVNFN